MTELQLTHFVVGILVVLLIGTQVFWSRLVLKMADRLMSRDFYDYVQAEKLKSRPNIAPKASDDALDPIAEDNARKANALFMG